MNCLNITLPENEPLVDGKIITFRTPCDCVMPKYLLVNNINLHLVDASDRALLGDCNVFSSNALISVLVDVSGSKAYLLNGSQMAADFNQVDESKPDYIKGKTHGYYSCRTNACYLDENDLSLIVGDAKLTYLVGLPVVALDAVYTARGNIKITAGNELKEYSGAFTLKNEFSSACYYYSSDNLSNTLDASARLVVTTEDNVIYESLGGSVVLPKAGAYFEDILSDAITKITFTEVNFVNRERKLLDPIWIKSTCATFYYGDDNYIYKNRGSAPDYTLQDPVSIDEFSNALKRGPVLFTDGSFTSPLLCVSQDFAEVKIYRDSNYRTLAVKEAAPVG